MRSEDKLFPAEGGPPKKKKKIVAKKETLQEMVEAMIKGKEQQQNESPKGTKKASTKGIVLEAELDQVKKELADVQAREKYWKKSITISRLIAEVIRMETGLPTREVFDIVVNHALRFKDSITNTFLVGKWNQSLLKIKFL